LSTTSLARVCAESKNCVRPIFADRIFHVWPILGTSYFLNVFAKKLAQNWRLLLKMQPFMTEIDHNFGFQEKFQFFGA
jgi:hypothetical protein